MTRRQFVQSVAALGGVRRLTARELEADVVIIGGGVGGCAAALAAARSGSRVILTEETDWIGGQLTQQAVPPDEHPWVERVGATSTYRSYRALVRRYYREHYPLTTEAQGTTFLNPGNCSVSAICHEPRVALAVLECMLAPHVSSGRLLILRRHVPVSADADADRLRSVSVRDLESGDERSLTGRYFLDATELGDLLPLSGTEYVSGAESQAQTGELHAPSEPDPDNVQAFTWCLVMDYVPRANHTIEKPRDYDFWRGFIPRLNPPWPGPLLSLTYSDPRTLKPRSLPFDPLRDGPGHEGGLWAYRRLLNRANFRDGSGYSGDICLVNWPQNDYWLGNLIDCGPAEAALHGERARQLSLSLLYWLQTEAGWPGLRPRGDLAGTSDGLAKRPYIRESRRIKAEFTVLEEHVGAEQRRKLTGLPDGEVTAAEFPDSVGIGSYRIDLHPSTGGDNYIDIASLPFEIPLGALIPVRMENLLPAAKNIGVTHITNGCYRLHPVEWNIGEVAGALADASIVSSAKPRAIRNSPAALERFQRGLGSQGIEIRWPRELRTAVR